MVKLLTHYHWVTIYLYKNVKLFIGDKYDYSNTVYINSRTKFNIICPEHGEFKVLFTL